MATTKDPRGLQVVDPVLTNLALNYRTEGLAYDQIGGTMDVDTIAGQYPEWSIDDFMRDDVPNEVSDRAETPEIDATYSLRDYLLKEYRLKVSISPRERAQAHSALRLEETKLNLLLDRMAIRRERRLAAALRKTTNGGKLTLGGGVSVKWDAASGATIEADIKGARKAVYDATGQHVDTMILTWEVAYAMALNDEIRDILKYTTPGEAIISRGEMILPKVLHGLNVVVVGQDKVNTAAKGAARSLASIWGDHVRLIKTAADNAWGNPATVYKLRGPVLQTQESSSRRTGTDGSGHAVVDRWAEADPPVDYIRAWECIEEKVVAPDVGYEIADVLT